MIQVQSKLRGYGARLAGLGENGGSETEPGCLSRRSKVVDAAAFRDVRSKSGLTILEPEQHLRSRMRNRATARGRAELIVNDTQFVSFLCQAQYGQHEWRLLLPALRRAANAPVALVGAPYAPFGPGLAAQGFDAGALA